MNEKPFEEVLRAFLGPLPLGVSLFRGKHQECIDWPGAVVSQRLSPLTNPLALCHLLTTVIDCKSLGHSNYTQLRSGHLFQHFRHLPKNLLYLCDPAVCFCSESRKGTHKIRAPAPGHDGASVTHLRHNSLSSFCLFPS